MLRLDLCGFLPGLREGLTVWQAAIVTRPCRVTIRYDYTGIVFWLRQVPPWRL